jgi:hypothetical protein
VPSTEGKQSAGVAAATGTATGSKRDKYGGGGSGSPHRRLRPNVVYPPCDTDRFLALPLERINPEGRIHLLSIAQFR